MNSHRFKNLVLKIVVILPLITAHVYALDQSAIRPNILLLFAEDMSSHLGAFGDEVAVTPNLDRLASEGVRFTNAFSTASTCAPSRSALLTGVHQIATGTQHMRTSDRPAGAYKAVPPAKIKAFPELLRAAGYYTFTDNKLDYQFSGTLGGSGPFTIWDDEGRHAGWEGREEGQNFFGLINFMVTHESGVFPPLGNWPHSVVHLIMQFIHTFSDYSVGEGPVTGEQIQVPPYYPDTRTVREDMARHYNNIYQMDKLVGKIVSRLETQGLLDNTIIIWTSDHGDGLPRAKRSLFDSGIKVPMIIRWPERYRPAHLLPGQVDNRMISFVDLAPTILKMTNVKTSAYAQGHGFLKPKPQRKHIFASQDRIDEVYDRQRAIRSEQFKYIRSWYPDQAIGYPSYFRDNQTMMRELWSLWEAGQLTERQAYWFKAPGEEQLYDIVNDPYELTNLAASAAHQETLVRMRQQLNQWLAQTGDWSKQHEVQMVEGFLENGSQRITAKPKMTVQKNTVRIEGETAGSSIGYQLNGGPWKLYTTPVTAPAGTKVTAKAVRYGWEESAEISLLVR